MSHNGMVICQQYANFQLSTPRMTGKCKTKFSEWGSVSVLDDAPPPGPPLKRSETYPAP